MKRVWIFDDPAGWGHQFYATAVEQGLDASMFSKPTAVMKPDEYCFIRVPQWGEACTRVKGYAADIETSGLKLIQDLTTIFEYEDKLMQTVMYKRWMPKTRVFRSKYDNWRDCEEFIEEIGYPFISKAREGSSSVNVRLIDNVHEAKAEYEAVMKGKGKPIRLGPKEGKQLDYLIWQKFCDGNSYDIRVCRNGVHELMLGRANAHGSHFASGSHNNWPINDPDDFEICALNKAQQFFSEYDYPWCGIDLVFDFQENDWKILETTLAWALPAYDNCKYFGTANYHGRNIWQLLTEQIIEGIFD